MVTFQKHYIGKGTQVNNLDIVRITLNVGTIEQHAHIHNGQVYITFEVAKLQKPQFNKTHTVYVSQMVQEPTQVVKSSKPAKAKK